ncbi:NAD(P)/FAD-dependent oxidoreductase [Streptomyces sp. 8L]|uniref:NAD(P)/FAD-dependent oxidoreductase n=1 Tax=Streptomyces sp. 8L TaxID=2877242 RepID=UPI001CD31CF2|nr:FAD-dependent oxidoreductase [Streptomyces sp. 8L]MCA1219943.1 FAD-dependent oxidoreductase [Streptomyces sp. 8L]
MRRGRQVIVGGGVAGAAAARGLRDAGFEGEVVLVGDEPHRPYERPPLSKGFLAGEVDEDGLGVESPGWYRDQEVELLLGARVTEIDTAAGRLTLSATGGGESGSTLPYDGLLLATGVRPRRLPGIRGERVHYPRTVDDARALRAHLAAADRVVVVGAGFIGCEVAATAVGLGKAVTVFEPDTVPFRRTLGPLVGMALIGIHRSHGVDVRLGEGVRDVAETASGTVRVTSTGGTRLECDVVVVGVGARPNTELAAAAGIGVDNGILTDARGRTSHPDIYAAGDVARQYHPRYGERLRVEHHDTAARQGAHVARTMLGGDTEFAEPFWFWSDQYEHTVQSAGRLPEPFEPVVRGDPAERSFSAFAWDGGRVTGVVSVDRPRDVLDVRRLVFAEHQVTREQLADADVVLRHLAPRRGSGSRTAAGRRTTEV